MVILGSKYDAEGGGEDAGGCPTAFAFPAPQILPAALAAQMLDQLRWMNRLGKQLELMTSLPRARQDLHRGGLSAEQHDTGIGTVLADGDGRFDAVDVRHHDIGEDQFRTILLGELDGLWTGVGGFGKEPVAVQDLHDGVGNQPLIVHDEYAGRPRGIR